MSAPTSGGAGGVGERGASRSDGDGDDTEEEKDDDMDNAMSDHDRDRHRGRDRAVVGVGEYAVAGGEESTRGGGWSGGEAGGMGQFCMVSFSREDGGGRGRAGRHVRMHRQATYTKKFHRQAKLTMR